MISRNKDKIILVFKKRVHTSHICSNLSQKCWTYCWIHYHVDTINYFIKMQRLQTININWPMNDFSKRKNKENEPTCTKTLSIYYLLNISIFTLFILLQQYLFLFINGPRLIVYLYINAIKNLDGRFHPIQ